jgi:hypothetical protein
VAFDNPHGFTPVKYDPKMVMWYGVTADATEVTAALDNIYPGDMVISSANSVGTVMAPETTYASNGGFIGVSLGIADGGSSETYLQSVPVCIDPNAIYRVQSNHATLPAVTSMWDAFAVSIPATYSGNGSNSDMEIIGSNVSASLGQFLLIGIVTGPQEGGGIMPTWGEANIEVYVKPNPNQMESWSI